MLSFVAAIRRVKPDAPTNTQVLPSFDEFREWQTRVEAKAAAAMRADLDTPEASVTPQTAVLQSKVLMAAWMYNYLPPMRLKVLRTLQFCVQGGRPLTCSDPDCCNASCQGNRLEVQLTVYQNGGKKSTTNIIHVHIVHHKLERLRRGATIDFVLPEDLAFLTQQYIWFAHPILARQTASKLLFLTVKGLPYSSAYWTISWKQHQVDQRAPWVPIPGRLCRQYHAEYVMYSLMEQLEGSAATALAAGHTEIMGTSANMLVNRYADAPRAVAQRAIGQLEARRVAFGSNLQQQQQAQQPQQQVEQGQQEAGAEGGSTGKRARDLTQPEEGSYMEGWASHAAIEAMTRWLRARRIVEDLTKELQAARKDGPSQVFALLEQKLEEARCVLDDMDEDHRHLQNMARQWKTTAAKRREEQQQQQPQVVAGDEEEVFHSACESDGYESV